MSATTQGPRIAARLAELGITLPAVAAPAGAYVPALRSGNYIYTSGQLPFVDGKLPAIGKVGGEQMAENAVTAEQAKELAATCAVNALAALAELVDLDTIRVVKVVGFVASDPDFTGQPGVINGASELIGNIFGPERGSHARSAVGVAVLPLDTPVEVEFIVEVVD